MPDMPGMPPVQSTRPFLRIAAPCEITDRSVKIAPQDTAHAAAKAWTYLSHFDDVDRGVR